MLNTDYKERLVPIKKYKCFLEDVYLKTTVDEVIRNFEDYIISCKDKMKSELELLRYNISNLETKCSSLEENLSLKDEDIKNRRNFNGALKSTLDKLQTEKVSLLKSIELKDRTIKNTNKHLEEAKSDLVLYKNRVYNTNKKELKTQTEYIIKLDNKIIKLNNEIERLKKENMALKKG